MKNSKLETLSSKQIQNSKPKIFTHLDREGKARMVDVFQKEITKREAAACGKIWVGKRTIKLLKSKKIPKGDVFTVAKVAGIQAAKKVGELIPLCHPLVIEAIEIGFHFQFDGIAIEATAKSIGKTGVEMEALTAVSVAALTVYDMCKAVDKKMRIGDIYLWQKSKQSV